ncbi:MAG: hypothetical protein K6G83_05350 [Lachnospiraceae bacterium]|nr:hypothetical protein [Lachnospiraceae bacterium]
MRGKRLRDNLISLLWLAFGYGSNIWFLLFRGKELLDSDMAAEMVLADILNREHAVLTKSWFYSTELRFLQMQWFYRLGLFIYPNDWHLARCFGMALALALLAVLTWFLFYSMGRSDDGIRAAALVMFPGGSWYFGWTLFGGYYLPFIYISLLTTALLMMITRTAERLKTALYTGLCLILAFVSGINGVKQLMVFYAPLVLAAVFLLIRSVRLTDPEESTKAVRLLIRGKEFRFVFLSLLLTFSAFLGYLVNTKYLAKIYSFVQYGDNTPIIGGSFSDYLRSFIWSYGYVDHKALMSFTGIASMCGVAFGILVIASAIRLAMRFKLLTDTEQLLTTISVSGILFCVFIFSYTNGDMKYYIPVLPFGIFLIVLEIQTEQFVLDFSRFLCMNAVTGLLFITSVGTLHNESVDPLRIYRAEPKIGTIAQKVVSLGYTDGISGFWTSQILAELTNGSVEMWTLDAEGNEWYEWLQRTDHRDHFPEGRYFYLYKKSDAAGKKSSGDEEMKIRDAFLKRHAELVLQYEDEDYMLYGN